MPDCIRVAVFVTGLMASAPSRVFAAAALSSVASARPDSSEPAERIAVAEMTAKVIVRMVSSLRRSNSRRFKQHQRLTAETPRHSNNNVARIPVPRKGADQCCHPVHVPRVMLARAGGQPHYAQLQ